MKIIVNIVLFLFFAFLSAPTIVSMMESDADISMVYSLTEEEIHKELKEIKVAPQTEMQIAIFQNAKKSSEITSENLRKHDNVSEEIFSPPPEQV
ncbi:MAG: hypothetical protein EOO45_12960 [Flavobacterium sp.]|nr:MAG: hypothetical protein EOO45_12960 [Flavobacterium sp.]